MSLNKCLQLFSKIALSQPAGLRLERLALCKCYSQYHPYFLKPAFLPEEQEEILKAKQVEEIKSSQIKAAASDDTTSSYYDQEIRDFINVLMRKGNRQLARSLVEETFAEVKRIQLKKYWAEQDEEARAKIVINPYQIFHAALKNSTPLMETTLVIRGGIRYQVPVAVSPSKARSLAFRHLIKGVMEKPKSERFYKNFARVLVDGAENTGRAVERKLRLHKLCEENRAYAHYRWT